MLFAWGQTDSHTGTLVGLYDIVEFTKITKDSTNLHDNK
jgi:hypothetical protein